jgi:hypothetical protein
MKSYLLFRRVYAFLKRHMRRLHMKLLRTRVKKRKLLLRMLSLKKHILINLKCASRMLSVTILKRNVTRLRIEMIDSTSRSLSILAAQTSRFLFTFLFFLTLQTQIYMNCTLQTRSNMNYKIDNMLF